MNAAIEGLTIEQLRAEADAVRPIRPAGERKPSPLRIVLATREEVAAASLTPREIVPGLLYADVRLRAAAGGVGKTTMMLHEAVLLALGRPVWGSRPAREVRTTVVTREDNRKRLLARLREICMAQGLTLAQQDAVFERVAIVDLSGEPWRLTAVVQDVVVPRTDAIDDLVGEFTPFAPDWIVFDPSVSFGTGEARTNDAEQGLIEACRILRNRLDCCVELIHHTGKQNARDGARDQYAFRGGSALADGARMVAIVNTLEPDAWQRETGLALPDGNDGIVMSLPKLSYARRPADIYVARRGFHFSQVLPSRQSPEQRRNAHAEQVLRFLQDQAQQGAHYSTGTLEDVRETLGLNRKEVRAAVGVLLATGRIVRTTGARNSQWLATPDEPASVAESDGETHAEEVAHA